MESEIEITEHARLIQAYRFLESRLSGAAVWVDEINNQAKVDKAVEDGSFEGPDIFALNPQAVTASQLSWRADLLQSLSGVIVEQSNADQFSVLSGLCDSLNIILTRKGEELLSRGVVLDKEDEILDEPRKKRKFPRPPKKRTK